jgi:ribosomal protein S27E
MHKEDVLKFRVGQCGSCGLRMLFWSHDGAKVTCVKCGAEHEVEVDAVLNLSTGEKTELVLLVPVWGGKNENELRVSEN